MMPQPRDVIEEFDLKGKLLSIEPFGEGLINDTFLVTTTSHVNPRIILQRLNRHVFPERETVMANLETLLHHTGKRQTDHPERSCSLRFPVLYRNGRGNPFVVDGHGDYWRAQCFIANSRGLDAIEKLQDAREVGWALGCFHQLVNDLNPALLKDTVPGFHETPLYLQRFETVKASTRHKHQCWDLRHCVDFVDARKSSVNVLEDAKQKGEIPLRPIHGDPKIDNFLFDADSRHVVSLIDLDTVQAGLIHYDIGDCLRSCCKRTNENSTVGTVHFDLEICRAILQSYLHETRDFLTGSEYVYLYDAIRLIPFELGLRFLTDHLEGNPYFKVNMPEQNLVRARIQFQLAASIERQEQEIKGVIAELIGK